MPFAGFIAADLGATCQQQQQTTTKPAATQTTTYNVQNKTVYKTEKKCVKTFVGQKPKNQSKSLGGFKKKTTKKVKKSLKTTLEMWARNKQNVITKTELVFILLLFILIFFYLFQSALSSA